MTAVVLSLEVAAGAEAPLLLAILLSHCTAAQIALKGVSE